VAGLTVAFRRSLRGDQVSVFEASPRLGGQLHTEACASFLIEHGAEGFIAGSPALARLADELGIGSDLLDQQVSDSCHFDGRQLVTLAPGEAGRLLGFQVGARALGKGIQSFARGMGQLVDALRTQLAPTARCHLATPVQTLRAVGTGWQLIFTTQPPLEVDEVIVATSASAAATLLEAPFGRAAAALAASEALSSVTVSLAYARAQVSHPLEATGFVVAEPAQTEGFRACTFASSKLPGRAPADQALLRLFFRPTPAELATLSDGEWTARAERHARSALPIRGPAGQSWVARWNRALPVFDAGHKQRVRELEELLRGSGIRLAGAAFHGSGIDGAVRSAEGAMGAEP
jgi:protoporphyrinogen/coproporphyrinogen III oxidase